MKNFLFALLTIFVAVSTGCSPKQPEKISTSTHSLESAKKNDPLSAAFEDANREDKNNSMWFNGRASSQVLNIVAPVYHHPDEKNSSAYKTLNDVLEKISKDPSLLDKASGIGISKKYKAINFIPFRIGSEEDKKYTAIYQERFSEKRKTNDIARKFNDKGEELDFMEIAIRILPDDLKENIYTLSGYKAVKEPNRLINSHFFHLSKQSSDGTDEKEVLLALSGLLTLSIPQYISVDRKEFLKGAFRVITDNPDRTYSGKIYRLDKTKKILKLKETSEQKSKSETALKTIDGHKDWITSVAITFDGDYIVSGSWDNSIKIWDLLSGDELLTLKGHTDRVTSLAIEKKNKFLISGGYDKTLRVWEMSKGTLLKTLEGHSEPITSVVVTSDGKFALSGSQDNSMRLWNIDTGGLIKIFKGHSEWVSCVAVTPDGKFALSGSYDNTIKIWDIATGNEIRTLKGHTNDITSIAVTPDGKYLISGSMDNSMKLWDLATGMELTTFTGHDEWINSVAISPDGNYALSGGNDKTIRLWNIHTGKLIKIYTGHTGNITSVAFSPDGHFALSGSYDKTIKVWDIFSDIPIETDVDLLSDEEMLEERTELSPAATPEKSDTKYEQLIEFVKGKTYPSMQQLHTNPVNQQDLDILFQTGYLNQKIEYNKFNPEIAAQITTALKMDIPDDILTAAFFNVYSQKLNIFSANIEDEKKIGNAYYLKKGATQQDMELFLVSRFNMEEMGFGKVLDLSFSSLKTYVDTLKGHKSSINSVAVSPDSRYALSGSEDKAIVLWDLGTKKIMRNLKGHKQSVDAVTFTKDGKNALSGSADHLLKLWNISTGKEIRSFKGHTDSVTSVAITPDGKQVVSGAWDATLRLWEIKTGKEIRSFRGHTYSVNSVAITPDGKSVLSGSWDKTLKLWNINSGKLIQTFEGHEESVSSVAISPDGRQALSGSRDNTVRLWDLSTGQEVRVFKGHKDRVTSVAFIYGGKYALSGSWDQTIILWEVNSGKNIRLFKGHSNKVGTIAATGDGTFLISGGYDALIKMWELPFWMMTQADY